VNFFQSLVDQQLGLATYLEFYPVVLVVFFSILFGNLSGLIGLGFTPASHWFYTLYLAIIFNVSLALMAVVVQKVNVLRLFIPSGLSYAFLPILTTVELFSYWLRSISLSVRLFANMMSGHALVFIFSSSILVSINSYSIFSKTVSLLPLSLLGCIFVLEIGIAFLQAYVFVLLFCIYTRDVLASH